MTKDAVRRGSFFVFFFKSFSSPLNSFDAKKNVVVFGYNPGNDVLFLLFCGSVVMQQTVEI